MNERKDKHLFRKPFVYWAVLFIVVNFVHLVKCGVEIPQSLSTSPPTCVVRWQEELITCSRINHTQIVESLGKIKRQVEERKGVAEGRKLGSGDGVDGIVSSNTTDDSSKPEPTRSSQKSKVRELNIFSCDVPKLTASSINSPSSLEILSVVNSGLKEVRPSALEEHAKSLTRLVLTYNHLRALPEALGNLTKLEVLDLSHNDIDHLPEGSLFFHLHRLRQLHLDHNKLGQILGAQARLGLKSPGLSMTVFNLEPLRESLTHVTLAHNDIAAFPEQFSRPFARLLKLDLSSNNVSEILPGGFQEMPQLQYLDLSGNLLEGLTPDRLPRSFLDLNLRGNPWNCDCNARWITENLRRNSSQSLTITPPTCSSPLHLRHRELLSLREADLCPKEQSISNKVVYVGDDVDGALGLALESLHLLNVTILNHQALIVSWRVDGDFYSSQDQSVKPLSWAVTLHKTKEDPRLAKVTRMKLERYKAERSDWRPTESLYTELLHGLDADEQYTLCLVPIQENYLFTRPDRCQHATTLKDSKVILPITTTTPTATSTTTTTTSTIPSTTTEALPEGFPISTQDYEVQTERVVLLNEARKVHMSWNVTIHLYENSRNFVKRDTVILQPLGWKITYRRFAEENATEIMLVSQGGEPVQNFTNHYTVEDLEPGTGYTFCFRPLSNTEVQASLKSNQRENFDLTGSPKSNIHSKPEVISSSVKENRQLPSHTSEPVTNIIDDNHLPSTGTSDLSEEELSTEPFYPDYEFSNIPSNIPPLPNFPPQGIPAHIPEVPDFPASPSSFGNRPAPPPSPNSGGNFVYTSTGERIPIPSSSGLPSPFNLPSIVGPVRNFNPTQSQWPSANHPLLDIPTRPKSQQQFTYDFDQSSVESSSKQTLIYDFTTEASTTTTTTKEPQRFTYVTRRKRSVDNESKVKYEKYLGPGSLEFCKEVVTLEENNIITPVAVASTVSSSTTVIIAIVFCCCCPKICRRKKPGWQSKPVSSKRKISTISNPTPVNVYTRQSSAVSASTLVEDNNSDLKSIPSQESNGTTFVDGDINNQMKNGRSVSVTSSNGYLTPLPSSNGTVPDSGRVFNEAKQYLPSQKAYLSSVKDRLLQQHKDLKDFHPGYDIPPTSSIKSLLGYDYPHPTPVNPIGSHSESAEKPAIPGKPPIPSPSSSDSNYNASVSDPREAVPLRSEVNLNIPFNQNKSSDSNKKFNLTKGSDFSKSTDYNYITPEDLNNKPRSYVKNGPVKVRHRKFGSPQRLPDELSMNKEDAAGQHHSARPLHSPSQLSRSVPDLATAVESPGDNGLRTALQPTDMTAAARLNLLIGNQRKDEDNELTAPPALYPEKYSSKVLVPSATPEGLQEIDGYVNYPASKTNNKEGNQGKDKDIYHTWSSSRPNTPRSRPSLGEVVLTGGTLIEVPEGYVIPKPPKPTRSVRLLVPGEDKPTRLDRNEIRSAKSSKDYSSAPTSPTDSKSFSSLPPIVIPSKQDKEKSQITHLMTPELDQNIIVISTGMDT